MCENAFKMCYFSWKFECKIGNIYVILNKLAYVWYQNKCIDVFFHILYNKNISLSKYWFDLIKRKFTFDVQLRVLQVAVLKPTSNKQRNGARSSCQFSMHYQHLKYSRLSLSRTRISRILRNSKRLSESIIHFDCFLWRRRLFYKSKLPEVQINLHFGLF